MGKIIRYECRRLLCNKFFAGLLLVTLFYGWPTLTGATILGVSHTAPFSPWSFGDYLSRMLPLLWLGALFFLTFFTSEKARRTAVLTDAAPMSPRRYAIARCSAALAGTGLLALACLAEAAVFYGRYFGWYGWETLPSPALAAFLAEKGTSGAADGCALIALLRRPQLTYADLAPFDPDRPDLPPDVAEQVEISVKYAGYIQRQQKQVADFRKMESRRLPPDLDYNAIQGLRLEAREKLNAVRPADLGQASRISGVSPADVTALMIYLER